MRLYKVDVRKEDEDGRQDGQVLIEAESIDEAQEKGLEFASGTLFFGVNPAYVTWCQVSGVETPYVMRMDSPTSKPKRRTSKPEAK